MDIIYRAFDGKFFDDEDDCISYEKEKRMNRIAEGVKFLDEYGFPLDSKDIEEIFYKTYYMFFETDEIASAVSEMAKEEGYHNWPNKKGSYCWDNKDQFFYPLNKKIAIATEELEKLNRCKRILEGEE